MNKNELIAKMAEKAGMTKKDAEKALKAFTETVVEALKSDDKVQMMGFGTFELKERSERTMMNPSTKEPMTVAAHKVPTFKAGKGLKDEF